MKMTDIAELRRLHSLVKPGRITDPDNAEYVLAAINAMPALLAKAEAHDALVAALKWYEVQTRQCRLIHSEGDAGRALLSADGGAVARAALAKLGGRDVD